ncbi:MAG: heavy metal-associated domain-containing protein [Halobacteriales archaeon]|nr:heavy metal-associated domain-containing protein [Halobacteriales archaeon]
MRYELTIESMHCEHCASNIERYLRKQAGVDAAEVDFETGEGWLEVDPGTEIEPLVEAIDAMGYAATVRD